MKTTVKIDLYTKVVLTAIALFLGILVFQNMNIVTTAHATPPPVIVHSPEPAQSRNQIMDVNIVQVNGYSVASGIPVKVGNTVSIRK
ncbi:MAG: hypothetical protein E6772_07635 [Dysgonomonas sp.]|nr:hypothetical protein [Dysgonomonas sp.]